MEKVYLLYEGGNPLSYKSMILMGVFSSVETLRANALKVIRERVDEHLKDAERKGFDGCKTRQEKIHFVVGDILCELMSRHITNGWSTNYFIIEATVDELIS